MPLRAVERSEQRIQLYTGWGLVMTIPRVTPLTWGHGACAGAGVGSDQAWVPASETAREICRASSVDGPGAGAMTARR